ncbi:hypothetical protein [Amycolatopsis sp. NPDC051903]|uniref:hypothetical protein n=1 Tax=Amycolatopsis sp. NPDC051903 TaxID=3363936 RepID=UPI00379F78AD
MTERDNGGGPRRGQAVAAMAIAAVSLVLVVATWIAWLRVRPKLQEAPEYALVGQVFLLVLGALFFVGLLAGVLAIVLGLTRGGRARGDDLARGGALLGALTCVIALAGAVTFAASPTWTPVAPRPAETYEGSFGTGS